MTHPAHALAAKGIAHWPEDANIINAAADLIAGNGVTLYAANVAAVASRSGREPYPVIDGRCTCEGYKYRGKCSHAYAVRMAWKLSPTIIEDDHTESQLRRDHKNEIRRQQAEARHLERRRKYNKWYKSSDGKRRYVNVAMANGATPEQIRPDIMAVAYGGGQ